MGQITLIKIRYNPGYCDMAGGSHYSYLAKDKEGSWIYTSDDRETHMDPVTTVTYKVTDEEVAALAEFISRRHVPWLAMRPKSKGFITDYNPWHWNIEYTVTRFGKTISKDIDIPEYKIYTLRDRAVLKELRERFTGLARPHQ
ncbi:MAG: hypothetical protein K5745_00570 [Saccharofermentans sp.]|nr:hypothetical protein [Saccharofermentans sp.]